MRRHPVGHNTGRAGAHAPIADHGGAFGGDDGHYVAGQKRVLLVQAQQVGGGIDAAGAVGYRREVFWVIAAARDAHTALPLSGCIRHPGDRSRAPGRDRQ